MASPGLCLHVYESGTWALAHSYRVRLQRCAGGLRRNGPGADDTASTGEVRKGGGASGCGTTPEAHRDAEANPPLLLGLDEEQTEEAELIHGRGSMARAETCRGMVRMGGQEGWRCRWELPVDAS